MPRLRPYSLAERLGLEYATLGVALSANPLVPYREQLARHGAVPAREVAAHAGESIVVGGLPVALRRHALRPGTWIGFLTLQDLSDLIEVVIGPEVLAAAWPAVARGGRYWCGGWWSGPTTAERRCGRRAYGLCV
jgi:DNA polymerase III alpha subunit